ncbi:DUF1045 domain-containing protein [Pleomorphomonas sp. PLEO]|uniref:DUF1045 domain-containing protein n=1 Tax=Pleomorphomonas sp. PLEO TaxID=3239306 RepID=UPI00351E6185
MPHRARYALYYAPPIDHPLTRIALRWLGRDAFGGRVPARTLPPAWEPLVTDPRRYGFHATLKPPMRLRPEFHSWDLQSAASDFASKQPPLDIGLLKVARIGSFFALVPEEPPVALRTLADAVVAEFDRFRAPMGAEEFARRNGSNLNAVEVENLKAWGYPYVFERFRFHMSLTGPVPEELRTAVGDHLSALFADSLLQPVMLDALTIFMEEVPQADFVALSRAEFGGT